MVAGAKAPEVFFGAARLLTRPLGVRIQRMNVRLILRVARWASIYFVIVFGVGFALGPIRVLWLEPRLGVRLAELIEAPLMFLAIVIAGRWVGQHLRDDYGASGRLAIGAVAAGLVLVSDLLVGVGLRGMSVVEVFTTRDPVSGSVYYALVALTAVAPWLLCRPPAKKG